MDKEQALREFGLNNKEVKVYLALLQLGTSKVNNIAKKAKILRETTYFILNSLINKGLVSYVLKSGIKYFEAAPPTKFKSILKEKENNINKVLKELESIRKNTIKKPKLELYEGKQGLKTILDEIIRTRKTFYAYANYDIFKLLKYYFPNFVRKRIKKRIYAKIIQEKTKKLIKMKNKLKETHSELRFSPIKFKSNTFIFGDNVAILTMKKENPIGILIHNKDIARTQKQVFNILWRQSKK